MAYANLRNDAGKIFTDHRLIDYPRLFSFKVDGEGISSRGVFFRVGRTSYPKLYFNQISLNPLRF